MRNLLDQIINRFRRGALAKQLYGFIGDETCGMFEVPSPIDRKPLRVIASSDNGWDHVSVSRRERVPNWREMEHVKRLFFHDDETAMQLHVPVNQHINCHPYTLHLWRCTDGREIPLPPAIMVGPSQEKDAAE